MLKSKWRLDQFRPFCEYERIGGGCSVHANEQQAKYLPPTCVTSGLL